MELLYIGSVCNQAKFDQTVSKSRNKPSASAQNFEMALVQGFSQLDNIHLTCISTESIAAYPRGSRLFLRKRIDVLCNGVTTEIIPAVNLPGLKNVMHGVNTGKSVQRWFKQTVRCERAVLLYGVYPAVAEEVLAKCRAEGCKCFCMVTDIAQMMFTNTKSSGLLKRLFSENYRKKAVELQGQFDGYIYLTEAMREAVSMKKPYLVMETIVDTHIFDGLENIEKVEPPVLMYAGALYRKYGVDKIVETFEKVKSPCQLWMFGSGDYEEELKEKVKENSAIHFGGRISRAEVLENEKKATLLLNLRNDADEYTKYSFPSKMVEYMLSGTPFLTTELEGIPQDYYSYVYSISSDANSNQIAKLIDYILNNTEEASNLGKRAMEYIVTNKNCFHQTQRICEFIYNAIKGQKP